MDMIDFRCSACFERLSVEAEFEGAEAPCPNCAKVLVVPEFKGKRTKKRPAKVVVGSGGAKKKKMTKIQSSASSTSVYRKIPSKSKVKAPATKKMPAPIPLPNAPKPPPAPVAAPPPPPASAPAAALPAAPVPAGRPTPPAARPAPPSARPAPPSARPAPPAARPAMPVPAPRAPVTAIPAPRPGVPAAAAPASQSLPAAEPPPQAFVIRVRRGQTIVGNFTFQGFQSAVDAGQILATDEVFLQSTSWLPLPDFLAPKNLASLATLAPAPPTGDYDGFIEPPL